MARWVSSSCYYYCYYYYFIATRDLIYALFLCSPLLQVHFRGLVAMPDGTKMYETTKVGAKEDAAKIGKEAGEVLKKEAGAKFFEDLYASLPPPKVAA